jgi:primosomal protein N' (replication factor Y)
MERKDGRYRAQLIFRATQRAPLHRLVSRALAFLRQLPDARRVRWSIDVDPLEI